MQITKKIAIAALLAASFAGSASADVIQSTSGGSFSGTGGQHLLNSVTLATGSNQIDALTSTATLADQGWGGSDPTNGVYIGLFEGSTALWTQWVAGAGHTISTQNFDIANDPASLASLNAAISKIDWSATQGQPVQMEMIANSWSYTGWHLSVNDAGFSVDSSQVPEPASVALLGMGLAGLAAARRKSKQK